MGVLGKDIFDLSRPQTSTRVRFGEEGYWVEDVPEMQVYGSTLTEILNLDLAPFQAAVEAVDQVIEKRDAAAAPRVFMDLCGVVGALPLYRLYREDLRFFGKMQVEQFVVGEARDAFGEFVLEGDSRLLEFARRTLAELAEIQKRYGRFLGRLSEGPVVEKKKGQRKEPLAQQMLARHLEPYVSGVSLGAEPRVDAPQVDIQYEVLDLPGREPVLVEKISFSRLRDFVYVECMRGMQKGFMPKRCANCGRWFLQRPGATFAYCDGVAPGETERSCREIGAISNFREKVKNSEIWQLHQRAYKKYFARTRKGTMSRAEFEIWSREAEQLRDRALEEYDRERDAEKKEAIVQRLKEQLNRI